MPSDFGSTNDRLKASKNVSTSHSAAASLSGYLYQARYALLRGLEESRNHPSHALSIEKFDDVAFEEDGQPVELIQTKHHGILGNVTDRSVDLWKTLKIWIQRIKEDPTGAANTRFVFLTNNIASDGSALAMLRKSDGSRDEANALVALGSAASQSQNQVTAAARGAFLSLTSTARALLVRNIWVFDQAPNIIDVRDQIEAVLHYSAPPTQISTLTDQLEGWWFNRVIMALSDPDLSEIPLSAIEMKVSDLRERFKIGNLLVDETIEGMAPVSELPSDERAFVRQMNLVSVPDSELRATVHDYYRAYEQRSRWARENLLLDGEADRYDRNLHDAWDRRFLACTADLAINCDEEIKEARGREVFRWSREYVRPFRNRDELWLSSGSFQMLADEVRIGWHPNYKTRLTVQDE